LFSKPLVKTERSWQAARMTVLKDGPILVTGADGFIGSHVVEELLARGAEVRAFVMYNSFNSWGWLDRLPEESRAAIEVISGDIRDGDCVRRAVKGCRGVLHLAALIAIPFSYEAPEAYVETNVRGTLNLLRAVRDLGVERFVQTSTSEVYGTAQSVPISEEHRLHAQSPYAASKTAADQMALAFHGSFETPVIIIRPFNTYGPRQSARAVVPTIITQLLSGAGKVRLGALHPTRDLSFVRDTARGLIAGLTAPAERVLGEVINLGSGFEIAIGDLAGEIAGLIGAPLRLEQEAERLRPEKSEVERLWADNSKAARLLDWRPEHGGLDGLRRGLRVTIEWFRDPANLCAYKTAAYNR
jgi:NAD dependent epimerase/dehydratase